jgi:hypothetical protein
LCTGSPPRVAVDSAVCRSSSCASLRLPFTVGKTCGHAAGREAGG